MWCVMCNVMCDVWGVMWCVSEVRCDVWPMAHWLPGIHQNISSLPRDPTATSPPRPGAGSSPPLSCSNALATLLASHSMLWSPQSSAKSKSREGKFPKIVHKITISAWAIIAKEAESPLQVREARGPQRPSARTANTKFVFNRIQWAAWNLIHDAEPQQGEGHKENGPIWSVVFYWPGTWVARRPGRDPRIAITTIFPNDEVVSRWLYLCRIPVPLSITRSGLVWLFGMLLLWRPSAAEPRFFMRHHIRWADIYLTSFINQLLTNVLGKFNTWL